MKRRTIVLFQASILAFSLMFLGSMLAGQADATPSGEAKDAVTPDALAGEASADATAGMPPLNSSGVWALDSGKFLRVMQSEVKLNTHGAKNFVGQVGTSYLWHDQMTVELAGERATTRLVGQRPELFIHVGSNQDMDTPVADYTQRFILVSAVVKKDKRVISNYNSSHGGDAGVVSTPNAIATSVEMIGTTGWMKMVPKESLPVGEYALVLLPAQQHGFAETAYNFGIDTQ